MCFLFADSPILITARPSTKLRRGETLQLICETKRSIDVTAGCSIEWMHLQSTDDRHEAVMSAARGGPNIVIHSEKDTTWIRSVLHVHKMQQSATYTCKLQCPHRQEQSTSMTIDVGKGTTLDVGDEEIVTATHT